MARNSHVWPCWLFPPLSLSFLFRGSSGEPRPALAAGEDPGSGGPGSPRPRWTFSACRVGAQLPRPGAGQALDLDEAAEPHPTGPQPGGSARNGTRAGGPTAAEPLGASGTGIATTLA